MVPEELIKKLLQPGPRLGWLKEWLSREVWSSENYQELSPLDYLNRGEKIICDFEELLVSAAEQVYDELISSAEKQFSIPDALKDKDTAVVIFDGLSVREMPMLKVLAEKSGMKIKTADYSLSSVPSETLDFIEQKIQVGRIAPSLFPSRKEFKEKGISAFYVSGHNETVTLSGNNSMLLWSSFPDNTYKDSGARFDSHFSNIRDVFETAWINCVQAIRNKKRIIITSDHGYIFLGSGLDFPRNTKDLRVLNDIFGNERCVSLDKLKGVETLEDVYLDKVRNLALLKGRVKTVGTGSAASRLYKHGGLSLMEMFTPWLELEIKG
ncbi:MAG: hypothetical protein JW774_10725 [Candidatus Aureabacteria bacterium]|nr:hypothetical protein [Candidatus Auribacterota bacterium]